MSGKIRPILLSVLMVLSVLTAYADDDDYIAGIREYKDGLYSVSAMSLEAYLKDTKDSDKADYSRYLLYHIYMNDGQNGKAYSFFNDIKNRDIPGMDKQQMDLDSMMMLTGTDCKKARAQAVSAATDPMFDIYLSSRCPVDKNFLQFAVKTTKSDSIKLRAASRASGQPDIMNRIFDGMDVSKMPDAAKRYFGLYFYGRKDYDRFMKVRAAYEDRDMIADELEMYWNSGKKTVFIDRFQAYRNKFEVGGANNCRAIDYYNDTGESFDCMIVDQCMPEQTDDFVKIKGACLAKNGDAQSLSAFVDSLKPDMFKGICQYGEYIFANDLYSGKDEDRFAVCDNRYAIADVMLQKQDYKDLVSMFSKPAGDVDRYYAAIGLKGSGDDAAAEKMAAKIKDSYIKAKLAGRVK